jgi:PHD/YefM family antitoxin component YafN of YafNO toxin-antitoxin module
VRAPLHADHRALHADLNAVKPFVRQSAICTAQTFKFREAAPLFKKRFGSTPALQSMKKQSMFSVAHLKAHTSDLVAAVSGSYDAVFITDDGMTKAVLQDVRAYESLHRAVARLEGLVAEEAGLTTVHHADIRSILTDLRERK